MAKNYWFKFDWSDWLNDEDLSACSLEAQGFWIRCLCFMYRADDCELTGTVEQLRRKLGVLPEELIRCLNELKNNGAANVRFGNGDVSIVSRRRQKELKDKQNNRLYVARHREKAVCKEDVSIQSKSKSKSKSKEEEKDVSIDTSKKKSAATKPKLTDDEWLDTLASTEVYKGIDVRREFGKASLWCDTNSRQCTRKFFINWLNRATPMSATAMSTSLPSPSSPKEQKAHERKNAYDNLRNFVDSAAEHVPGPNAADRPQQLSGPSENDPLRRGSGNGNGVVTSLAPLDPRIPLAGSV